MPTEADNEAAETIAVQQSLVAAMKSAADLRQVERLQQLQVLFNEHARSAWVCMEVDVRAGLRAENGMEKSIACAVTDRLFREQAKDLLEQLRAFPGARFGNATLKPGSLL